jgi:hypothetical protein
MSNYPDKIKDRAVHPSEPDAGEGDIVEYVQPSSRANGFFSFSYSYKEISSRGGKTYVKSKETRFEDGKLKSEAFEGTLHGSIYGSMVSEAQKLFLHQTASFLKQLSWFLPFPKKERRGDD